ncbi:unnamed protein product [Polarella glacialis]|uniref:Uncharacterized protein n=1 Tax=Polarella glacialis TaxID=89957 RepID=A0A813EZ57_POLGL|nr:unnamed protein product [Polarella glacialis]
MADSNRRARSRSPAKKRAARSSSSSSESAPKPKVREPVVKTGVHLKIAEEETRRGRPLSGAERDQMFRDYAREQQGLPPLPAGGGKGKGGGGKGKGKW